MEKKRLPFIDALRGLAIFLVVLGHSFMFNGIYPLNTELETPIPCFWYNALSYFRLPLFFFISGYFLSDKQLNLKELGLQIWKKVRQLLIPFFICSFILALWKGYTYWFLKALFTFFLLCYPFNYIKYKFNCGIVASIIYFVIAAIVGVGLSKIQALGIIIEFKLEFFIFFILGHLNKKLNYMSYVSEKLSAVFILIFCAWCYAFHAGILNNMIVNYFVGFLLTIVVWNAFSKIDMESNCVLRWFSFLGKNTIEIYILHFYFGYRIPGLTDFIVENILSGNKSSLVTSLTFELIVFSILAAFITFLSVRTSKIIKSNKYIALLLFGRE